MSLPFVTDHAVLRYLERARGIDIEFIRQHVALLCAPAANAGAKTYRLDEVTYVFKQGSVVTVLGPGMRPKRPGCAKAVTA